MSKEIETSVSYSVTIDHEDKGKAFKVPFSFTSFDSVSEAVEAKGEAVVLGIVNQTLKEDAGNVARENARRSGGHSAVKVMSEEDKAEAKAVRAADKALLEKIKANPELLAELND